MWESSAASCLPDNCFCEAISNGNIKQVANSYSSLAFCFVGCLILFYLFWKNIFGGKEKLTIADAFESKNLLYPLTVIYIGIGSYVYHSKLTFAGQFFDVSGMNALAIFILLFHFDKWRTLSSVRFFMFYILLNLFTSYLILTLPELRRYLFAIILLSSLVPLYLARSNDLFQKKPFLFLAIVLQLVAFIIWILDITKIVCDPGSIWQGHALWHILSALACGCLYLFYEINLLNFYTPPETKASR